LIDKQNIPSVKVKENDEAVRSFFDRYFLHQITFPSNQIDAVVGHFLKRGFDELAAKSTAIVLLNQSRIENINVFQLIDTLKGLTDQELSGVVAEVLNTYREKTSSLGFKDTVILENYESRNIRQ
jgi:hypothetical protein